MHTCQACKHHPGIGRICTAGNRHATAAPKFCRAFTPDPNRRAVAALRKAARLLRRAGDPNGYAATLQEAHEETAP